MDASQNAPSLSQAIRIKKLAQQGEFDYDAVYNIMNEEKKSELDGYGVRHRSPAFDLKCLLGTVTKVGHDDTVVEGGTGAMTKACRNYTEGKTKEELIGNIGFGEAVEVDKALKKKVLITGAGSYIGQSFIDYAKKYYPENFEIDELDMMGDAWKEYDFSQYDIIYHVAGIAHADVGNVSDETKEKYYQVNTDLTIEVAQKAKEENVKEIIFMSSMIVYGESAPYGKKKIIDENTIADNASPTLLNLRKKRKILEQRLKDKLQDLVHSKSKFMMDSIITIRDGRYVVPVKEEYRNEIKGLVHDISSSGSTLYIEPITTFEMNNEIQNIKVDEEKEIIKILKELTLTLAPLQDAIFSNIDTIGNLDLIFAKASYSSETNGNEPILNKDKYLNFVKVRHPLINKNVVVPIDIEIGKDFSCLVITGPNTGGKTATLKTVGLNLLLSYSGIYPLCNIGTSICVFDKIFIDIGDEQSIQASLSTFSSHMTNIINITNSADSNSLILLDELGSGTDPIEGASLAISTLKYLYNAGSIILSTTHYPELKNYALVTKGFKNASCDFDVASLRPTYKLLIGIPGKSNAFAISKKLGLKKDILEDAENNIDKTTIHIEDLLKNIYDNKLQIENEKLEIEKNLNQIQALRKSLEEEKSKLDFENVNLINESKIKARNIILSAKEEANEIIKELNNIVENSNTSLDNNLNNNLKSANSLRDKLNKSLEKSLVNNNNSQNISSTKLIPENIKIGMSVFVIPLQQKGIIQSLPNRSKEVLVQIGNAKINVKINNLKLIEDDNFESNISTIGSNYNNHNKSNKSSSNSISFKKSDNFKTENLTTEINVIGLTIEEATQIIDKYLDSCMLSSIPTIRIVHGKGTGKLMRGIHAYLKNNSYVKNYRIAAYGEGDLGVTIVELKN